MKVLRLFQILFRSQSQMFNRVIQSIKNTILALEQRDKSIEIETCEFAVVFRHLVVLLSPARCPQLF